MKKTIFRSMLAISMIAAASLMNSCNRDDDNSSAPLQQLGNAQINPEAAKDGYMILVTEKAVGQAMSLYIDAETADQGKVWIDLNNDGVQQTEEKAVAFSSFKNYTLGAPTVVIYGKVNHLICRQNQLQALEVTKNTALRELSCSTNQMKKTAMNTLLKALPVRNVGDNAWVIIHEEGNANEGNELPDAASLQAAKAKNWKVYQLKNGVGLEL